MKKKICFKSLLHAVYIILLIMPVMASAQKVVNNKDYYETYPDKITGRIYLSQKYAHYNFPASNSNVEDLEYKANPKLNLGLGITIHNFSANIFYGFAFLNKNDKPKGETKGLNIQLHLYPHKWAIDLYGEFPKGLHLEPKGFASNNPNNFYYREDVKGHLVGISAYKVPNKEKFSYRAAILQTEWQKKSAGSVLYGGDMYYGSMQGDSALIPVSVQGSFPQAGIKKINYFSIGPGVGYAYTVVIDQHFFITGSMVGNMNLNFTKEESGSSNSKFAVSPATVFKAALGYNSSSWNVSANWTGNGIWFKGSATSKDYFWPSGNYRLVLAKKFENHKHHNKA
jgi:Domain of unknown function (DUF4421)